MKPVKRVKISEFFIHLGGWIILFSIPFFFMEKGHLGFQMNWGMYQHHCVELNSLREGLLIANFQIIIIKFRFRMLNGSSSSL